MANAWDAGKTIYGRGGNAATVDAAGFMVDAQGNKTTGGDNGGVRNIGADGTAYAGGQAFGYVDQTGNIRSGSRPMEAAQAAPAVQAGTQTASFVNAVQDQNNGTVQGQIKGLIDANSPLMQRAAQTGLDLAGSRGLLNSGMAISSAQNAVYDHAVPIATSDAGFNNQFALTNAGEANTTNRFNTGEANTTGRFNAGEANATNRFNTGNQQQVNLANMEAQQTIYNMSAQQRNNLETMATAQGYNVDTMAQQHVDKLATMSEQFKYDSFIANLDATTRSNIAQLDAKTKEYLGTMDANTRSLVQTSIGASTLFGNYIAQMSAIMVSADMDAAGKEAAIANLRTGLKDGLAIQGAIADLDIAGLLV